MENVNVLLVGIIIFVALILNVDAATVTVDFNSATSIVKGETVRGGDFDLYEEDGFRLFAVSNGGNTQSGRVRISDGFTTSLSAFPNFGFGVQDFLISTISGISFDFLSLDIYEAAGYHPVGTLLVEGIRAGITVSSQTFTTDGVTGPQEFSLSGFTNLDKIRMGGNRSSEVGVDNLTFNIVPEPATFIMFLLGFGAIRRMI